MDELTRIRDLCREAGALCERGRTDAGLELARAALASCASALGEGHYAYPHCLITLGWLEELAGLGQAPARFEAAWAAAEGLAESDFEHAAMAMSQVLRYLRETGRTVDAGAKAEQLLRLHERHLGVGHPRTAMLKAENPN